MCVGGGGAGYSDFYLLHRPTLFFGGSNFLNLLFFWRVGAGVILFQMFFRVWQFGRLIFWVCHF